MKRKRKLDINKLIYAVSESDMKREVKARVIEDLSLLDCLRGIFKNVLRGIKR